MKLLAHEMILFGFGVGIFGILRALFGGVTREDMRIASLLVAIESTSVSIGLFLEHRRLGGLITAIFAVVAAYLSGKLGPPKRKKRRLRVNKFKPVRRTAPVAA